MYVCMYIIYIYKISVFKWKLIKKISTFQEIKLISILQLLLYNMLRYIIFMPLRVCTPGMIQNVFESSF